MNNHFEEMNSKKHFKKLILDCISIVVFMKMVVMYDVYLSFDGMIVMNKVSLKRFLNPTENKN
jgi:hypothetical protein